MNKIKEQFQEILELRYAPLFKRFLAFFIDVLLLYLNTFLILKFGLNFELRGHIITFEILSLTLWYLFLFYLIFFNIILDGQTFGYKLLGIKVVSADGQKARIWQIITRSIIVTAIAVPFLNQLTLFIAISWFVFSILLFLNPSIRKRKQLFWDISSKTCVVEI